MVSGLRVRFRLEFQGCRVHGWDLKPCTLGAESDTLHPIPPISEEFLEECISARPGSNLF